ncbi:hypothetical protein [Rubinisphaera margarita]|uniref:hypothetical protein n=1 Tax=Rubinisphaera margarita TaxID=2909586 RepID=UPI001EE8A34F|nr:hypothetical protein [Rubinisphaera margarita]MCG6156809.1 hypothetical protein [Rubinisphaera margarita]
MFNSTRRLIVPFFCLLAIGLMPIAVSQAQSDSDRFRGRLKDRADEKPAPRDQPSKGLRYDEQTNRWVYDEPGFQPVPPGYGPVLTPPVAGPVFPGGPGFSDEYDPPNFDWGTRKPAPTLPTPGLPPQQGYYPNDPGPPRHGGDNRYQRLAESFRSELNYLYALTSRENITREHQELLQEARTHASHFADLIIQGGDYNRVRAEYSAFDEAWHPAAYLFAEGQFSNRTLAVVQSINQLDNLFHAEMNFEQADVYNRNEVAELAGRLVQLTERLADEIRRGNLPRFQPGRAVEQLARETQRFSQTVRRDGDHSDVVESFGKVDAHWAEVSNAIYRSDLMYRDWQTGRMIHQVIHDLRHELRVAPQQQQPTQLARLISELQGQAQTILQLVRQQGGRRNEYNAWMFAQDCQDLELALSSSQASFHRQVRQTLDSWAAIRGGLDGHQFVQPIRDTEQNLRVLERFAN